MKSLRMTGSIVSSFLIVTATLGAAWTTKKLTAYGAISFVPTVVTSGANVYVVWHTETSEPSEVFFMRSPDNCANWQPAQQITNHSGSSQHPTISFNATNIYVAYDDDTPSLPEIYLKYSPL